MKLVRTGLNKSQYKNILVHSQKKKQMKRMKSIVQIAIYALECAKTIGVKRDRKKQLTHSIAEERLMLM